MTNLCRKEFFLYVPTANDVETLTQTNIEEQETPDCLQGPPDQFFVDESWVKIPLQGEVVAYAHVWGEQDQSCGQ